MNTGTKSGSRLKPARQHHRTVDRIGAILDSAARSQRGVTLSELAARLEAPVSSIQALVNGLVASGYLVEDRKKFLLGLAPYILNLTAGRPPVSSVTEDDLDKLALAAHNAVVLGVHVGDNVVYIHRTDPVPIPRLSYIADSHVPRPLIGSTAGRVFLAYMDERERNARLAEASITHPMEVNSFLTELESITKSGIATGTALCDWESASLAAPIFENGQVRAAVTIMGRSGQIEQQFGKLGRLLWRHTRRWRERAAKE